MNITICGCGNGAHACAALLSRKGHSINIFSPLSKEVELFKTNYEQNNGLTLQIAPDYWPRQEMDLRIMIPMKN